MKPYIFLAIIPICTFIIFQLYVIMATLTLDRQQYEILYIGKDFEIRNYTPSIMNSTYMLSKSDSLAHKHGFQHMTNYIMGGNEHQGNLAMVTPVHLDIHDSISKMSFVIPSRYRKYNMPLPEDASNLNSASSLHCVAAITFSGYPSDNDIRHYQQKLKRALNKNLISYLGNFKYIRYNPPYQLFGRKNEIVIQVIWEGHP